MTDAITNAMKYVQKTCTQSYKVGSYFSRVYKEGIILVNLQDGTPHEYAVWNVDHKGNRTTGGYYVEYSDAMQDYDRRLERLIVRENNHFNLGV